MLHFPTYLSTPPTDEAGWEKVFSTAKEYGLNHLRFHSWCPPEAAFKVADKKGFYLQVEPASMVADCWSGFPYDKLYL